MGVVILLYQILLVSTIQMIVFLTQYICKML